MARTGKPAGRPRHVVRKLVVSITEGIDGWLRFMGAQEPLGMSGYLVRLAREDRARSLAEGGEVAQRYRLYLEAMGNAEELESLGEEEQA